MSNVDIHKKIDTIENLMELVSNELAVLKMGLEGRGTPKVPNRKKNAIKDAVKARQLNRMKKATSDR